MNSGLKDTAMQAFSQMRKSLARGMVAKWQLGQDNLQQCVCNHGGRWQNDCEQQRE